MALAKMILKMAINGVLDGVLFSDTGLTPQVLLENLFSC
jgi:hypothetical protein